MISLISLLTSTAIILGTLLSQVQGQSRNFVDDYGVVHVTNKERPTFVTRARNALFFSHHGADTSQLIATYGNFFVRGSQLDLNNPATSDALNADPTLDDIAFLKSIPTLSPSYYDRPQGCQTLELDLLRAMDPPPDFWVYIDNGGQDGWDGFFTKYIQNITAIMGKPPIFIDTIFEDGHPCRDEGSVIWNAGYDNAEHCISRSIIDVLHRTQELAEFLGVPKDADVSGHQAMCAAAQRFTRVADDAHKRGIRVGLAYFIVLPEDAYVGPLSPLADTFPRTLEELGLPIVHPGLCLNSPCNSELWGPEYEVVNTTGWFPSCNAGQPLSTCNEETVYNFDFWLLDGRTIKLIQDDEFFKSAFPDKALLAGQYAHVPMNDGTMSYEGVARFLNDIADQLEKAKKVYDTQRECIDADVTSTEHISLANSIDPTTVEPGHLVCFNRNNLNDEYWQCPSRSFSAFYSMVSYLLCAFLAAFSAGCLI